MKTPTQYGRVEQLEELTPKMVRVTLGGEGLAGFEPTPFSDQYVNAQFVPDGAPYSPPFDIDEAQGLVPVERQHDLAERHHRNALWLEVAHGQFVTDDAGLLRSRHPVSVSGIHP